MVKFLIQLAVNGIAVFITAYILPGVEVDSFLTALVVSIVLGAMNAFIKPILVLLTLPITILTLGLFSFVISAGLILAVSGLVAGFAVVNFWWALAFAFVLGLVSSFLSALTK